MNFFINFFLTIFISSYPVLAENCPIPNLMPLVKKVLKSDARKKIVKKVIKEDVVKAAIEKTIEAVEENNVDDEKIKRTIWVGLFSY
ncbi:MAG: hypothetical protein HOL62_02690 [Candidatus Marinimicrobia bacterium]|jgi:hypothetical protein|nr:hypothetical protein [Candidatus Neomarinimicrobiota bacterium]MBT4111851.1 hypothetical protein [Candidatus Neomarinimicrobiota bacterium]MBT4317166.1 hypothetical protein [Candidatus Neomarinimicrobiota bacterium]MBT4706735.1 hypothetical protein [Candidatus Neomarinimicrobiota bacterium]MBT5251594.1 hypothetical protein [Candidatus Neomarinimicrobiota bacterium]